MKSRQINTYTYSELSPVAKLRAKEFILADRGKNPVWQALENYAAEAEKVLKKRYCSNDMYLSWEYDEDALTGSCYIVGNISVSDYIKSLYNKEEYRSLLSIMRNHRLEIEIYQNATSIYCNYRSHDQKLERRIYDLIDKLDRQITDDVYTMMNHTLLGFRDLVEWWDNPDNLNIGHLEFLANGTIFDLDN